MFYVLLIIPIYGELLHILIRYNYLCIIPGYGATYRWGPVTFIIFYIPPPPPPTKYQGIRVSEHDLPPNTKEYKPTKRKTYRETKTNPTETNTQTKQTNNISTTASLDNITKDTEWKTIPPKHKATYQNSLTDDPTYNGIATPKYWRRN